MMALGMARISSTRATRASMFSQSAVDSFAPIGSPAGFARSLGAVSAQDYYNDAKVAVAKFDSLVERLKRVANQTVRDSIAVQYGLTDPSNTDKAMYMRNVLAGDIADAEKYTPVAYEEGFPAKGPSRGRVSKLQSFNSDFEASVSQAEQYYGILPEPQTITNYVTTQNPLNWILPVVALGVGIIIAGYSGVFKK